MSTGDIRGLPCSNQLKEVIHRCLGVRHKRYETAQELLEALSRRVERLRSSPLATLSRTHLTFTGRLSVPRSQAAQAARPAGAIVDAKLSRQSDVMVRGRANDQQVAGPDGGLKLMDLKRLRRQGYKVRIISERQFWRLADR
jgi:NAD-dependent DNA ligase